MTSATKIRLYEEVLLKVGVILESIRPSPFSLPSSPALKAQVEVVLKFSLERRGRQITAPIALTLITRDRDPFKAPFNLRNKRDKKQGNICGACNTSKKPWKIKRSTLLRAQKGTQERYLLTSALWIQHPAPGATRTRPDRPLLSSSCHDSVPGPPPSL